MDAIYLDVVKAFDTVLHERLLYKINRYKIKDPLLGWIISFLSNWSQCVMINGFKSESVPVTSGIPHVLGPLLFVIYINDLPDSVNSNVYLFADDAKIYESIASLSDHVILQHGIDHLTRWSSDWLLIFNPDKCNDLKVAENTFRH